MHQKRIFAHAQQIMCTYKIANGRATNEVKNNKNN